MIQIKKLKKIKGLITVLILLLSSASYSQDVIFKKNGEEINAIIKEITTNEIKYKRHDNPEGPLIHIGKRDVFKIKYQNGTSEIFSAEKQTVQPETPPANPHPAQPIEHSHVIRPVKLSGPRLGVAYISPGRAATQLKEEFNAQPFLSLFGWQFETQFFTLPSGTTGIIEFVPLIGGLEQGLFLPTASMLVGMRGASGIEFGVGPNLSLSGAAMVFAAGINVKSAEINFPVNFAVVASPAGLRYSILVGFNMRSN